MAARQLDCRAAVQYRGHMSKMIVLGGRIRTAVGGDMLNDKYYKFLLVHTGFTIFTALPGVFINTFLMGQTNNMDVVLIYNALSYAGTAIGMFFSAAVVHRFQSGVVSVLGILGLNLLYFQLILFNTHAADYVVLLGVTSGLANAFYWVSYTQLFTEFTNLQNRDSGMAIVSIMSSVVNVIIPLLAGAVISGIGGMPGYDVIFGLAFVIGLVTAVGAIRLPKTKMSTGQVHHKEAFLAVLRHKALLFGMLSEGCKGIREGAFGFILSILLYKLIKSEILVGFNTFLSSAASIVSFILMSKMVKSFNRIKYMEISVAVLFAFSLVNIFTINPVMLIAFTVVNAFFSGFILNSSLSSFLDAVQIFPDLDDLRPEIFAQKELCLATGRCLGIFLIMFVNILSGNALIWQAVSLLILTLTQVGTIAACKHTTRLVKEDPSQRSEG